MANSWGGGGMIYNGERVVTTAGAEVRLVDQTGPILLRTVTIVAKDNNTGRIYIGGSDVASSTNRGLAAGDSVTYSSDKGINLAEVWVDSSVNGDGVDFYCAN